jgi:protein TonB
LHKSVQNNLHEEKKALGSPVMSMPTTSGANTSQPLFNPPPIYPREARRRKIQGIVMVRASLSEEGAVASAVTLAPRMDPMLEDAALRAIHQWRFKPGIRTVEVPIEFKLVV